MSITARRLMLAVVLIALAFGVYLVDLERRTVLGERALRATQLEFLDFDTALARSRSTGRPVLAEFSAIWCPACASPVSSIIAIFTSVSSASDLDML